MDAVITTTNLGKRFGPVEALRGLNLEVPRGSVFGYLGRNGAGKSTTIKLLLDLLKPTEGSCTVLGHDPQTEPVAARQRVGYVAEGQKMYGWMKVREIIRFTKGFYKSWDDGLADGYVSRFELPADMKVKNLSKGQNARLSLLLALSSRPDLLILDDPTMGLDPISRQEFLADIVRAIQEEGRTVFFSTHILQELEQVADWVGIIDRGELLLSAPVDELKATVKRYELTLEGPAPTSIELDGLLRYAGNGRDMVLTARGEPGVIVSSLRQAYSPLSVEAHSLSLDEIFTEVVLGGGEGLRPYMEYVADESSGEPDPDAQRVARGDVSGPEVGS